MRMTGSQWLSMCKNKMMMKPSKLICRNAEFLRNFHTRFRAKQAQHALLKDASDEHLLCFVEICLNLLKGKLPLRRPHLKRLAKIKHTLRCLARARCPRTARKILLLKQQEGKGFPAVAGVLASVVVPLLMEKLINKEK
jgi:hypothetical protein